MTIDDLGMTYDLRLIEWLTDWLTISLQNKWIIREKIYCDVKERERERERERQTDRDWNSIIFTG